MCFHVCEMHTADTRRSVNENVSLAWSYRINDMHALATDTDAYTCSTNVVCVSAESPHRSATLRRSGDISLRQLLVSCPDLFRCHFLAPVGAFRNISIVVDRQIGIINCGRNEHERLFPTNFVVQVLCYDILCTICSTVVVPLNYVRIERTKYDSAIIIGNGADAFR